MRTLLGKNAREPAGTVEFRAMSAMHHDPAVPRIDLSGQVVLITGGGRGLGRSFAEGLAAAGASVAVVGRSETPIAETVAGITAAGGRAIAIQADVTDPKATEQMRTTVERALGPVDVLVNNAAITTPVGSIWEVDPDAWWEGIESNVRGPFLCCRAVLPGMIARRRGRIINLASTAGLKVIRGYSAYSAGKAALLRLTENLAAEVLPYGVQVFAIEPGLVKTALTEYLAQSPEGQQWLPWIGRVFAEGRDDPPAHAVQLVLFLVSGRGDALTGRFLHVANDPARLVARLAEIEKEDWYTMRLRLPPA
jgi:NAD(P)-dependent dehydrogenase (short-subunit alcohol dehydrogenase family)